MTIVNRKSSIIVCILLLVSTSACGKQVSSAAQASPVRAFVASDFENNADSDSDEIDVPVVARDPFAAPGGLSTEEHVAPVRRLSAAERVRPAAYKPSASASASTSVPAAGVTEAEETRPPEAIEVIWPDIRLSGMLRDAHGRWMAVIDGNVIRVGEWITRNVKLAQADASGVIFMHRTGAIRRIKVNDERGTV